MHYKFLGTSKNLLRADQPYPHTGLRPRCGAVQRLSACDCEFVPLLARRMGSTLVMQDKQVLAAFPDNTLALSSFQA